MIAHLTGKILRSAAGYAVIQTGGVGYKVYMPPRALGADGEDVSVHIHTVVREDSIELFGFLDPLEERAFELLISVSGVGPKVALAILSSLTVRDLASAAADDGGRLLGVPGVGKKTAQRVALDVGERLSELALLARTETDHTPEDAMVDVVEGLISLGYNRADARRAAQEAAKVATDQTVPGILTKALSLLTSRKA